MSIIFIYTCTFKAFCSLLKRDMSLNFKSKGNCLVSVLTCNVLMAAYLEEDNWPDDFVKVGETVLMKTNIHASVLN